MPLLKNVANQKIAVFAYDVAAGAGKTGDQANITAQISKDFGGSAALNDTNPVQLDATNHPGWYVFDLTQAETNADCIIITVSSTTAGIRFAPLVIYPTVYDAAKAGYLDGAISDIPTVAEILAGVVEGTLTMQQVLRLMLSALAEKSSGGGTSTVKFRDHADSKDRITATVDASGNRTAVTLDGS